jgi:hypothetical protein
VCSNERLALAWVVGCVINLVEACSMVACSMVVCAMVVCSMVCAMVEMGRVEGCIKCHRWPTTRATMPSGVLPHLSPRIVQCIVQGGSATETVSPLPQYM